MSDSIPVPVITRMSVPAKCWITFTHRPSSMKGPRKTLLSTRNSRLSSGESKMSRIAKAGTLRLSAVSFGPPQIQRTSAFGRNLGRFRRIACSVHSLPRFPTPNIPKRATVFRAGSTVILLEADSECLNDTSGADPCSSTIIFVPVTASVVHKRELTLFYKRLGLDRASYHRC